MQNIALFTLVAAVLGTAAQATTGVVPLPTQLQVANSTPQPRPIVLAARRAAPMPPPARRPEADRPTAPKTTGREQIARRAATAPPRRRPHSARADPRPTLRRRCRPNRSGPFRLAVPPASA